MTERVVRRLGLFFVLACAVAVGPAGVRPSVEDTIVSTGLGQAETLLERYELWAQAYEASGAESNLVVPLNAIPGPTDGTSTASGSATLDMVAGTMIVEVNGLPRGQPADVWLVDNQPGRDRTVAPEAGDRMLRLGTLQAKD